jgi:hypothetical protein
MSRMFALDESENQAGPQMEVRVCRTRGCGLDAEEQDGFCPRCREEIDALREMARRRFIIHGIHSTSGDNRRGTRRLALRRC